MVRITGRTLEVSGWWGAYSGSGGGPKPHEPTPAPPPPPKNPPWWKRLWDWLRGKR